MHRLQTVLVSRLVWGLLAAAGCAAEAPQRPPELEAAHRLMQRHPDRAEPYLELSRLYASRGDYLRARQYLSVAERLPAKDPRAVFRLSIVIAVRAGQYEEALARCRQQLEREEDPHIRVLLASVYEALGRWSEAERERKLVLAAWPEDLHQVIELARFYQRSSQPDGEQRAAELYRRYLQAAPAGPEAPQARAALQALFLNERAQRRPD